MEHGTVEIIPGHNLSSRPPGVSGYSKDFGAVAAKLANDTLLHLINFTGSKSALTLKFSGEFWQGAKKVYLEPAHLEISFTNSQITLTASQIDTILRFEK